MLMHKGIMFQHLVVRTIRNQTQNTSSPCHVIITMLEHVPILKHMRSGAYCTNTCVQLVLPKASLLAIQKLNADPKIKNFQKTIELGWSDKYDLPKTKHKSVLFVSCFKG